MMVVLSILKWIGIVLGCLILGLLALALLILLVVLFVPFRYQATVATDETGEAKALYGFGVTWIAHAISVRKKTDSDRIVVRLFGIPIKKLGGEDKSEPAEDIWDEDESPAGGAADEAGGNEAGGPDDEVGGTDAGGPDDGSETVIEEFEDLSEEEDKKEKKEQEKRKTGVESIKNKIHHTFKKIRFIFYKISCIIDFVRNRASKQTIKKLIKEVVAAIRYVGPKKISGNLEFGTGDPGSTGLILSGVSLCKLAYKKDVTIRPNFEEKCLVGDCTVRGRVRVVYFVRMALRIWFNKDVHHLWRRYRQMKKDFKKQGRALGLDS